MKQKLSLFLALILTLSTICVSAEISFNRFKLSGETDTALPFAKSGPGNPFTNNSGIYDKQSYLEDVTLTLKPKIYFKFDEGYGSSVTDSVSGTQYSITGSDFKWINDADIRYGNELFYPTKQKSALKLNTSYINLGEIAELNGITGDFSVVFWTNHEIFGRNEDYVEQPYQTTLSAGSYRQAYDYDKNTHFVILQSDSAKIGLFANQAAVNYSDTMYKLSLGSNLNNDYYNMYTVLVRKNASGDWVAEAYGTDKPARAGTAAFSDAEDKSMFGGNLYIGTPTPSEVSPKVASMPLGLAGLMVFDHALTLQERLEVYYGYKQLNFYTSDVKAFEN